VRLYVRPQRETVQHAIRRHAVEIVRQSIEIDESAGGFEVVEELRRRSAAR
jgi:hypothetical protein